MECTISPDASSVANSIGSALLSIPQGVWEVSDDNAQSAANSIGSALMDIIVVLDVLTLPGGGLKSHKPKQTLANFRNSC